MEGGTQVNEIPTPETDAVWDLHCNDSTSEHGDPWLLASRLETSMRKLHAAYKRKVQGELLIGHYDKGALKLLEEIQREYPSLSAAAAQDSN
jgi:hypothetical protein